MMRRRPSWLIGIASSWRSREISWIRVPWLRRSPDTCVNLWGVGWFEPIMGLSFELVELGVRVKAFSALAGRDAIMPPTVCTSGRRHPLTRRTTRDRVVKLPFPVMKVSTCSTNPWRWKACNVARSLRMLARMASLRLPD